MPLDEASRTVSRGPALTYRQADRQLSAFWQVGGSDGLSGMLAFSTRELGRWSVSIRKTGQPGTGTLKPKQESIHKLLCREVGRTSMTQGLGIFWLYVAHPSPVLMPDSKTAD